MARTPEKAVKNAVAKILNELDVYYFFPATGGFGKSGVPDIIACYRSVFIGIECKAGGNTPTALQVREINSITEHGGIALVINELNIETVRDVLEAIKDGRS